MGNSERERETEQSTIESKLKRAHEQWESEWVSGEMRLVREKQGEGEEEAK